MQIGDKNTQEINKVFVALRVRWFRHQSPDKLGKPELCFPALGRSLSSNCLNAIFEGRRRMDLPSEGVLMAPMPLGLLDIFE
jgi:hypothetical protein